VSLVERGRNDLPGPMFLRGEPAGDRTNELNLGQRVLHSAAQSARRGPSVVQSTFQSVRLRLIEIRGDKEASVRQLGGLERMLAFVVIRSDIDDEVVVELLTQPSLHMMLLVRFDVPRAVVGILREVAEVVRE